ncbi:hypothetical protein FOC4_g10010853 [Fusarium odoratissimum]|uniref:Uncharacterized protein n=2 Tax=Fusarium oxysporum species complex TaxID=171631 RepID=N1RFR3_FUSC4|nr:hypothetical protein FOC4_g10010853 [Fusarium odoratissimum]TXC09569.1 hypothetical protein FocTR4_00005906 [Fusarium oxysporum f. sp. cubense]
MIATIVRPESYPNILCNSRQSLYSSRNISSDVALLFSPLMPSNHCNDIDTTSNTAMTITPIKHR